MPEQNAIGLAEVEALQMQANAAEEAYGCASVVRYVMVFFPIPILVVMFRLP